VGIDPDALIMEYDAAHGAPRAIRAAEVFEPSTPIKLKERRPLNWSVAMIVALAVIAGFVIFHVVSSGSRTPVNPAAEEQHPSAHPSQPGAATASSSPEVSQGPGSAGRELVIKLVVKSEPCWVEFTSLAGAYLTQVTLPVGATKTWTFSRAVDMQLGNPGAVVLTVNGKDRGSPGSPGTPITLSFHPGKQLTS
jgi:cytoskeleton protein RodZ